MEERTLESFEALLFLAGLGLVDERVELLFLPPMAELAGLQALAPLLVAGYESTALPVLAEFGIISEQVGFPPVVLEVVGIHALGLVVVVVVGTPLGLEVKYVKVKVLVLRKNMVDEPDLDIFDRMCEGAVVSVLALGYLVGEEVAELGLVFIFVVEPLHSVVRPPALVLLGALLGICELAQFRSVVIVIPSLVLNRVEEVAALVVVGRILLGALDPLEVLQVQVLQLHRLPGPVVILSQVHEDVLVLEGGRMAQRVMGVLLR